MPDVIGPLLAALVEDRGDPASMLVLADALEDEQKDALAHAYRWAANRRRWPYTSPALRIVRWRRAHRNTFDQWSPPNDLPWAVFEAMSAMDRDGFRTVAEAFEGLAKALAALRRMTDADYKK